MCSALALKVRLCMRAMEARACSIYFFFFFGSLKILHASTIDITASYAFLSLITLVGYITLNFNEVFPK